MGFWRLLNMVMMIDGSEREETSLEEGKRSRSSCLGPSEPSFPSIITRVR
jgi:hypothetical protein